jgi:hypothetical protein
VAVSTIDVLVRLVGVGHLRLDDGGNVVRSYERPLQLPERAAMDDLRRMFRRHLTTHPDAMARHLAKTAFFGRPLNGMEHEQVEFELHAMAVAERVIAAELLDVYRSATMANDAIYARQSFESVYSSLLMRPAGYGNYCHMTFVERSDDYQALEQSEQGYVHISNEDSYL